MNKLKSKIARVGEAFLIDSGEYSDYVIQGLFTVVKEFNPDKEVKKFISSFYKKERAWDCNHIPKIVSHLLSNGFITEVEYATLSLNAYGIPQYFSFTPVR